MLREGNLKSLDSFSLEGDCLEGRSKLWEYGSKRLSLTVASMGSYVAYVMAVSASIDLADVVMSML